MKLIIFGNSEIAKCAYEYFSFDSDYEVVAFTVDGKYSNQQDSYMGLPLIPFEKLEDFYSAKDYYAFAAIGAQKLNRLRAEKYLALKNKGYRIASYISTKIFKWHNVQIGEHAFILENNTLQPYVQIGNNITLWSGNHIGHSSIIQDNCFITSHVVISGCCNIGKNCFIGVNSSIADCVTIGNDNFIGMHTKVDKSTLGDQIISAERIKPSIVGAKTFCRVSESVEKL